MRLLRIVGLVLIVWAVAAMAFAGLHVPSWFRKPSPSEVEIRKHQWERSDEGLILGAATAGFACLALASLAELRRKPRSVAPAAQDHSAGPADCQSNS